MSFVTLPNGIQVQTAHISAFSWDDMSISIWLSGGKEIFFRYPVGTAVHLLSERKQMSYIAKHIEYGWLPHEHATKLQAYEESGKWIDKFQMLFQGLLRNEARPGEHVLKAAYEYVERTLEK